MNPSIRLASNFRWFEEILYTAYLLLDVELINDRLEELQSTVRESMKHFWDKLHPPAVLNELVFP